MPTMSIILDGDGAWPDLKEKIGTEQVIEAEVNAVAALNQGMQTGLPSVCLRINLPDGRVVLAQTSMRLWNAATRAFIGRFGSLS